MKDLDIIAGDELTAIADQGVRFIILSALTDPENAAKIETLKEPKRSIVLFLEKKVNSKTFLNRSCR